MARGLLQLLLCFGAMLGWGCARAADITIYPDKLQGFSQISIVGEIKSGDEQRFQDMALRIRQAIVFLDSPGGDVRAGLEIGRTIRLRDFVTAVPSGKECASACGLIWLGGHERLVYAPGRVGFHAAYRLTSGKAEESGAGNALIGAYLNQLELTQHAIEYFTLAPPDQMRWLDETTAQQLQVQAEFIQAGFDMPNHPDASRPKFRTADETIEESTILPTEVRGPETPPAVPSRVQPPALKPELEGEFTVLEGRDIYGADLGDPQVSKSFEHCRSLCESVPGCMGFVRHSARGLCYLKSNVPRVWWNREVASGYRSTYRGEMKIYRLSLRPSSDLVGSEYRHILNSKTEDCADACERDAVCSGFTFSRKLQGRCSLRTGNLKFKRARGMIAGVKTKE